MIDQNPEMGTADAELTGACLCGRIRYRLQGPPTRVNHCHCIQCRRHTGAAFATWVTLPAARVRFEGDPIAYFRSSDIAERGFCASCGSALVWRRIDGDMIDLSAGTLDEPGRVVPDSHYWAKDEIAWLHMEDGLPRHNTSPKG
jgi:hypothetical protein